MDIINKYGVYLRLVEESDAEFILNLRTNSKLSQHISFTSNNILNQIKWIQDYKSKELQGQEYYYISQDQNGNKYGTIRLYDFDESSFELGSWIFMPNSPLGMAAKSHFLALEIGFKLLNFDYCKIRVKKKNIGVAHYIDNFRPIITLQDEIFYYFTLSKENFNNHKYNLPYLFSEHQEK